jgi:hypothetical protein
VSIPLAAQFELFLLASGSGLARRLLGLLVATRDFPSGLVERRGRRRAPRSWGVWLGRHVHSSTAPWKMATGECESSTLGRGDSTSECTPASLDQATSGTTVTPWHPTARISGKPQAPGPTSVRGYGLVTNRAVAGAGRCERALPVVGPASVVGSTIPPAAQVGDRLDSLAEPQPRRPILGGSRVPSASRVSIRCFAQLPRR